MVFVLGHAVKVACFVVASRAVILVILVQGSFPTGYRLYDGYVCHFLCKVYWELTSAQMA